MTSSLSLTHPDADGARSASDSLCTPAESRQEVDCWFQARTQRGVARDGGAASHAALL